ncbi:ring canal kelch homolog [Metopolophium dirhodum]|uniref:ring canal kelch homolog n=1 Tax=Metopolophium dirhodum TaxID=44670 RepID=UPI00298FFF2C|nr:ring canal kelch homolog [Metopolophium dirhodum]
MFTSFSDRNKGLVVMRQIDSTTLQLLVDFIYCGKIMVTEKNVQVLLPAANFLLLTEVIEACYDFLQKQLHPTNCLGIHSIFDLHNRTELLTSSELYIQRHFTEVVEGAEFLSLSSEQVVKLISNDKITVPSEEKVFECVIRWVKHELGSRKCILPQLMEHVRLPLTSKNFILKKVAKEPLLNNCPKCKDYIIEALDFHLHKSNKSDQLIAVPHNVRAKPRLSGGLHKVILVVGGFGNKANSSTEWYDPKINRWQFGPKMITRRCRGGLAVVKDNFVFAMGGSPESLYQSVDVLDLSLESPCWKSSVDMLVNREDLGVGVINNYLYAVGGCNETGSLKSAEVFDCSRQEWHMVCNMSTRRDDFGVGVLNNILYAVGGHDFSVSQRLRSVECYNPSIDTWSSVADMRVSRSGVGVGVLDGVLYAAGGHDGFKLLRSVETYRPSTGVWTTIADMHLCRNNAGVVALDGLLYVVGGDIITSIIDSVEFYNPNTNSWTMVTPSMNVARTLAGVVTINRPPYF